MVDNSLDLRFNLDNEVIMGAPAQNVIDTFDEIPDPEKREVAAAILRRTLEIEFLPVSDDELILNAEETFLELDRREAEDARS